MKKQLYYASAMMLALSMTNCSNEENLNIQSDEFTIEANFSNQARTILQEDSKEVVWHADDQVYLFGEDSYATMTLSSGEGENEGLFKGKVYGRADELQKALYPVPTIEGDNYTYEFPAERTWSNNSQSPMFGELKDGSVSFRNLTAIVRIDLDGCIYDDNSTLKLDLPGQNICGIATVNLETEKLEIEEGDTTIIIKEFGKARFLDIPVPTGEYQGFRVTLNDSVIIEKIGKNTLGKDDVLIDGKVSMTNDIIIDTDGTYLIKTAADLFWLADQVNRGETFEGKTFKLVNDINLANKPWIPIGSTESIALRSNRWPNNYWFRGVFDGNGKTIKNINAKSNYCTGLFGAVYGDSGKAVIKNLKIENATISGHHYAAALLAYGYGAAIENCEVVGATISCTGTDEGGVDREGDNNWGGDKAGALLGYMQNGNGTVSGCKASNCTVSAGRDAGQLIGAARVSYVDNTNQVDNISVTCNETDDGSNIANELIGRKFQ